MSKSKKVPGKSKIEKFTQAVSKLRQFADKPVHDERDIAGIIQAFEFSYELAWKALQSVAEEEGLRVATPLEAFQNGFKMNLIHDDEQKICLLMKEDRNLTSHTYEADLAEEVLARIVRDYIPFLEKLVQRLNHK